MSDFDSVGVSVEEIENPGCDFCCNEATKRVCVEVCMDGALTPSHGWDACDEHANALRRSLMDDFAHRSCGGSITPAPKDGAGEGRE